jgi:hypothetical protein
LKRRSWEGSRSNHSNQSDGKEETPTVVAEEKVDNSKLTNAQEPVPEFQEIHLVTEKSDDKEIEKDKDHNKLFSRKLKTLRRGKQLFVSD